jgi:hypothetical protein
MRRRKLQHRVVRQAFDRRRAGRYAKIRARLNPTCECRPRNLSTPVPSEICLQYQRIKTHLPHHQPWRHEKTRSCPHLRPSVHPRKSQVSFEGSLVEATRRFTRKPPKLPPALIRHISTHHPHPLIIARSRPTPCLSAPALGQHQAARITSLHNSNLCPKCRRRPVRDTRRAHSRCHQH